MRITGKSIVSKLKKKNKGNQKLNFEIDQLINDLENFNSSKNQIKSFRKDADCVHKDGFYFFNIHIHRILILIEFDEEGEATIIWAGSHDEYEYTFKNNKSTIEKWLRKFNYI